LIMQAYAPTPAEREPTPRSATTQELPETPPES
jgi:hypothetical protein